MKTEKLSGSKRRRAALCVCFCILFAARPVWAAQKEKLFLIPDYEKSGLFPAGRARNGYLLADGKLYLDTEKELFRLDMKTGEAVSLMPFEKESPGCEGDFCKWGQYLYVAENTAQGGKLWKLDELSKNKELLKTPGYDKIWEVHVQEDRLYFWGNRGNGSYLYSGYELKEDGKQGKKIPYEDAQITFIEKKLPLKENTQILYADGDYALGLLPAAERPGQDEKYYGIVTDQGTVSELSFSKPIRIDGLDRQYFYYHYDQNFGGLERLVYCRQPLPDGGPKDMIGIFSEGQVWDLSVIGEQVYYKLKKADGSIWLMRFPADQETVAIEEAVCLQEAALTAEQKAGHENTRKAEEAQTEPEATKSAQEAQAGQEAAKIAKETQTEPKASQEQTEAKASQEQTEPKVIKKEEETQAAQETSRKAEEQEKQEASRRAEEEQGKRGASKKTEEEQGAREADRKTEEQAERDTGRTAAASSESSVSRKLLGTGKQADGRIRSLLQDIWEEQYPEREWGEDSFQIAFQNSAYVDILLPGEKEVQDCYLFFDRRDGSLLTILDVVDCDLDSLQQQLNRIFRNFREYPGFTCNVRAIETIEFLPEKEGLKLFVDTGKEYGKISGILRYEDVALKINCKTS